MLIITSNQHGPSNKVTQESVPLKHITIDAHVHGFAADVVITQVYENKEDQPIEAVYCFPIEEQAAIYSFKASVDDREIIAQLKEKQVAQQEYSDALRHGDGAYLMEQNEKSQDNFIVNVGALPPSKQCTITIAYVTELRYVRGSMIEFVLPTTIAPRYSSEKGSISGPAGTTSKYVQTAPYTIDLRCHIDKMGQQDDAFITRINSPSHPIQVDFSRQQEYLVTFARENTHLDRDILINVELSSKRSNAIVAVEPGAIMAAFTPTIDQCREAVGTSIQNEFIFVIDCSGSMQEESKIGLARESMKLFLKSLPLGCYFNIIRFGSRYECLFKNVVELYNEQTAKQADELMKTMSADLGGTELHAPLHWLAQSTPSNSRSRQIFLLTDGEISDVNQVLELCRSMATSTRIFSFGLGSSPSRSLVKGLARTTNGRFVFIPPGSKVDIYVGEQLEKALQPSIVDTNVVWNVGFEVKMAPKKLPPVYANDRFIVYGLSEDRNIPFNPESNVELRLRANDRVIGCGKINQIPHVSENQTLARLAAKALILELQHEKDSSSDMNKCSGSVQARFDSLRNQTEVRETSKKNEDQRKKEIIELSLKYNILSPHTAFIAIEKRINGNNSGMVLREVPIEISADDKHLLPSRFSSFANRNYASSMGNNSYSINHHVYPIQPNCMPISRIKRKLGSPMTTTRSGRSRGAEQLAERCSKYSSPSSSSSGSVNRFRLSPYKNLIITNDLMENESFNSELQLDEDMQSVSSLQTSNWPSSDDDKVRYVIDRQNFDGLWSEDKVLVNNLANKELSVFRCVAVNIDSSILMTMIVIAVLEQKFSNYSSLWYGVVQKARARVVAMLQDDNSKVESILQAIVQLL